MGLGKYLKPGWAVQREEPEPLEGTRMDLHNSILPNFYAQEGLWGLGSTMIPSTSFSSKVRVANRCQQLNSQQIAGMRLEWVGPPGVLEPAWVSSPDPNVFPNGIGDALFGVVDSLYGWGYALLYVTDFYANMYPRRWTQIPSASCTPRWGENGRREYKMNGSDTELDASRIVQIDRNPTTAAHGTSALAAYAQSAWGLLAAGDQSMKVSSDALPQVYLYSERPLSSAQSDAVGDQYLAKMAARGGKPPVFSGGIEPRGLSINPSDLALLDTQQWNAMVLATAYGVPGPVLNMALTGGLTYQNPIALMQMWWLTELKTTSKRIMDALSAQMLPAGQFVWQDATDATLEGSIEGDDDPQASTTANPASPNTPNRPSNVAKASPAQQPGGLTAIGGGRQ